MHFPEPTIFLYKGHKLHNSLIRWQTWGVVSHAAMIFPSGLLYEAVWPRVQVRTYNPAIDDEAEKYNTPLNKIVWDVAESFAKHQVGKRYNWRGLIRFMTRDGGDVPKTWFCSDLVFRTFQYAGLDLLARVPYWKVSPEQLRRSPILMRA